MAVEQKAFASLSSGLLARKGAARPAMRPQGFGQIGGGLEDDLGWNDMGFEPPRPVVAPVLDEEHDGFGEELPAQPLRNPLSALTPVQSPVHEQQAEIEGRFGCPEDASEEGEEFDETAEIYDPEVEPAKLAPAKLASVPAPAPVQNDPEPEPAEPALVAPAPVLAPVPASAERRASVPRAVAGGKAKAAFTLRLDPERHLKLRLACAVDGRSAQQLVTNALDEFLASMPELDAMAVKAKRKE